MNSINTAKYEIKILFDLLKRNREKVQIHKICDDKGAVTIETNEITRHSKRLLCIPLCK